MSEVVVPEAGLPLKFPDPREEARARAQEFQQLSPDGKMQWMLDVLGAGIFLLNHSPNRAQADRVFQAREEEWQRIQRDLFADVG